MHGPYRLGIHLVRKLKVAPLSTCVTTLGPYHGFSTVEKFSKVLTHFHTRKPSSWMVTRRYFSKNASTQKEQSSLMDLWRRYGTVAIATHFGVYFSTLAMLYGVASMGLLNGEDDGDGALDSAIEWLEPYVPQRAVSEIRKSPQLGAFAVAWVAAKFTEPPRLLVTLFLIPRIARRIGRVPPLP